MFPVGDSKFSEPGLQVVGSEINASNLRGPRPRPLSALCAALKRFLLIVTDFFSPPTNQGAPKRIIIGVQGPRSAQRVLHWRVLTSSLVVSVWVALLNVEIRSNIDPQNDGLKGDNPRSSQNSRSPGLSCQFPSCFSFKPPQTRLKCAPFLYKRDPLIWYR